MSVSIDSDQVISQEIAATSAKFATGDSYLDEKVRPFLRRILGQVMDTRPEQLERQVLLWLVHNTPGLPEELSTAFRRWTEAEPGSPGTAKKVLSGGALLEPGKPKSVDRQPSSQRFRMAANKIKAIRMMTPHGTPFLEDADDKPPTLEERLKLLHAVDLFNGLEAEDLENLANRCEVKTFADGHILMNSGDNGTGMHVIAKGHCRVLVQTEKRELQVGDSYGGVELLKECPLNETVEASGGPVTTLHVDVPTFKDLGLKKKLNSAKKQKENELNIKKKKRRAALTQDDNKQTPSLATHEAEFALISNAIRRNRNLMEVLHLTDEQLLYVGKEAYKEDFQPGDMVCHEGDPGHQFYVISTGVFEVSQSENSNNHFILRNGDSFGELALLYDAPRAATVTCKEKGSVWAISRVSFTDCARIKMQGKMQEYSLLISKVDLFKEKASDAALASICNLLEEKYYVKGETIVEQGQQGSTFYIVLAGECDVLIKGIRVKTLQTGDYFGEKALISRDVRSATVRIASDHATLLCLDKFSFDVMMQKLGGSRDENQKTSEKIKGCVRDELQQASKETEPDNMMNTLNNLTGVKFDHADLVPYLKLQRAMERDGREELAYIPRESLSRVGVLGQGAFGFVTLERDSKSNKLYALKAMCKTHLEREGLVDQVKNEKICLELLDSIFCTRLVTTYRDDANVYLLLEPCFGGELYDVYDEHCSFFQSEPHALFYAGCTAIGLDFMHSRRIIYRDLKLENCLLDLKGYLKLADMGIAKICIGKTYTVCGTADYMAPETLRREGHNRAVDWWALAVMIFIMTTGRFPFQAPDVMSTYKRIIKGFAKVNWPDDYSGSCQGLIRSLGMRKPEERLTMGSIGVSNFKDHPWYHDFKWALLESGEMIPPYIPELSEEGICEKVAKKTATDTRDLQPQDFARSTSVEKGEPWDDIFDMTMHE